VLVAIEVCSIPRPENAPVTCPCHVVGFRNADCHRMVCPPEKRSSLKYVLGLTADLPRMRDDGPEKLPASFCKRRQGPVLRKKLQRKEMIQRFQSLAPTVIEIETYGGSHCLAR
jgi:hypothetical protein